MVPLLFPEMVTPDTPVTDNVPFVARSFTGVVLAAGPSIWKPVMLVATFGVVVALEPLVSVRAAEAEEGETTNTPSTTMSEIACRNRMMDKL